MVEVEVVERGEQLPTSDMASRLRSTRTYHDAIKQLNQLQSGVRKRPTAGTVLTPREKALSWVKFLQLDVQKLLIIHVAGTKGKGTTCLYTENIIQTYHKSRDSNNRNKTVGCLVSPHISSVRERIRVNGEPISEATFASYFWSLWDKMIQRDEAEAENDWPAYPSFLTLLAFYIFVKKAVDIAIIETGMGGETDTTNIIDAPIATGISALGLDHTARLGNTIQSIAWHKAGIFKRGRPAWSVPQPVEASDVLRSRADEKGTTVRFVDCEILTALGVTVKPDVTFQRENAALALSLATTYVSQLDPPGEISPSVARCIETTEMPVKFEILPRGKWTWVLSSAHNEMSIQPVTQAFVETFKDVPDKKRILVYSHDSQREVRQLFETMHSCTADLPFNTVLLCPQILGRDDSQEFQDFRKTPESWAEAHREQVQFWRDLDAEKDVRILSSVADVLRHISEVEHGTDGIVLVIGSGYLAGMARHLLKPSVESSVDEVDDSL